MKKKIGVGVVVFFVILLIGGALAPSEEEGEPTGGTATAKYAIFNDCSDYVTDVNLIIDGESVKHIAIYNGYWADWGTYTLEEGSHEIKLEVEYFDPVSHKSRGTKTIHETENVEEGDTYAAGYFIDETGIAVRSYPGAIREPSPANISEWEEKPIAYNYNKPVSMLIGVEYEREDWETTNTGPVDHLIYSLQLFDNEENACWRDGHLTLKIWSDNVLVCEIEKDFTENDIESPYISGMTEIYRIENEQIEGPVMEAETYTATYETVDGEIISNLVGAKEREISGPYPPKEGEANIEILNTYSYRDSSGFPTVVGEVKNTGDRNANHVEIVATFYESGDMWGSESTYTGLSLLEPNQKSSFEVSFLEDVAFDNVDIQVQWDTTDEEPYDNYEILSHSGGIDSTSYWSYYEVTGEVKNTGNREREYNMIVATFYDSTGKVVASEFTLTDIDTLSPGQKSPFSLSVTNEEISKLIDDYSLAVQS